MVNSVVNFWHFTDSFSPTAPPNCSLWMEMYESSNGLGNIQLVTSLAAHADKNSSIIMLDIRIFFNINVINNNILWRTIRRFEICGFSSTYLAVV